MDKNVYDADRYGGNWLSNCEKGRIKLYQQFSFRSPVYTALVHYFPSKQTPDQLFLLAKHLSWFHGGVYYPPEEFQSSFCIYHGNEYSSHYRNKILCVVLSKDL